jgi:manganese transport protein
VVGTSAGQTIVQDFIGPRIPLILRRVVTMIPAIAIVVMGVDVTKTLVMSQVVLSLVLPIPLVALVYFTSRRSVMGAFANRRITIVVAVAATVLIVGLNVVLIATTMF